MICFGYTYFRYLTRYSVTFKLRGLRRLIKYPSRLPSGGYEVVSPIPRSGFNSDKKKKVAEAEYNQGMNGRMRKVYTRDSNKRFSSEIYRVQQKIVQPLKICKYSNQDE